MGNAIYMIICHRNFVYHIDIHPVKIGHFEYKIYT